MGLRDRWRRGLGGAISAAFLLLSWAGASVAQPYPTRPIRLVVPYPAGSGPDEVARMLGDHLRERLGQTVIIDNRAGALGSIASSDVARSAPDGHTLLLATSTTHASNVSMLKNLSYNPVSDFAPIGQLITSALVMVVKSDFPARNLQEFVTYARAHKGELTAGYGTGTGQLSIAQLRTLGDIVTVPVAYRGTPPAVLDVIAGSISLTFADTVIASTQIKGGKLRGLGVTSLARSELLPDVPPLADAMPGFDLPTWYGLVAPARTPDPIIDRLAGVTREWLAAPRTRERLLAIGISPAFTPPAEFGRYIESEVERWTALTRAAGIQPE